MNSTVLAIRIAPPVYAHALWYYMYGNQWYRFSTSPTYPGRRPVCGKFNFFYLSRMHSLRLLIGLPR